VLTALSRVHLEKINASQLLKAIPHFIETEGTLPLYKSRPLVSIVKAVT